MMHNDIRRTMAAAAAIVCGCFVLLDAAPKIKVKAEPDPTYDFATVKTWAWDAQAGDVMMARTPADDPAQLKQRVDPLIQKYVTAAMAQKGLTNATDGKPDVFLHYYVLVTVNQTGQYMGQFLPSVAYWGLPPFTAQSTALDVATKGSIVLDALLPGEAGNRRVIWRGMAQSTIPDDLKDSEREARLKYAAEELVRLFPLTKKKK